MKAKIKKIAFVSAMVAVGVAGYASAWSVSDVISTNSQPSVKICKTISSAKDAPSYSYSFKAKSDGLVGLPKVQTISFAEGETSKCIDVDISSVAFVNDAPKQIEVEVTESVIGGLSENNANYSILFDLHDTFDKNNNVVGQVTTAFLHDASGAKVSQFNFGK
jgi:hypothetical protein